MPSQGMRNFHDLPQVLSKPCVSNVYILWARRTHLYNAISCHRWPPALPGGSARSDPERLLSLRAASPS